MNGVVAPKEKGAKTKFGKKGSKKENDGTLTIDEMNIGVAPQEEKPKKKFGRKDKKGGE